MLRYEDGRLTIDGRNAEQLAREFETPAFVVSERRLRDNQRAVAEGFEDSGVEARVRYHSGANAHPAVLRALADNRAGIVVTSAANAELAVRSGFRARNVALQRPALCAREAERACELGVRRFHVYQPADVETLARAAATSGQTLRLSLRLATGASAIGAWSNLRDRGGPGLRGAEAMVAAHAVAASRSLVLHGIGFHLGTQQTAAASYQAMLRKVLRLACRIERELCTAVGEIDIGGGFPSPSLVRLSVRGRLRPVSVPPPRDDDPAKLRVFARDVARGYLKLAERGGPSRIPVLVAEPGRAIAGNAGVLLTRVHSIVGRVAYLDIDAERLPQRGLMLARAVIPARAPRTPAQRVLHLAAGAPHAADLIDALRRLPAELAAGDLLVVADAGAYGTAPLYGETGLHRLEAPEPRRRERTASTTGEARERPAVGASAVFGA